MYHGVSIVGEGPDLVIVVPMRAGTVYGLDRLGQVRWSRTHEGEYLFAPSTVLDLDGDGDEEVVYAGRGVYAVRARDGTLLWSRPLGAEGNARGTAPVDLDADGTWEVVLAAGSKLLVLDGATGEPRFERDVALRADDPQEKVSSAPLVGDFDGDGSVEVFLNAGVATAGRCSLALRARHGGVPRARPRRVVHLPRRTPPHRALGMSRTEAGRIFTISYRPASDPVAACPQCRREAASVRNGYLQ